MYSREKGDYYLSLVIHYYLNVHNDRNLSDNKKTSKCINSILVDKTFYVPEGKDWCRFVC